MFAQKSRDRVHRCLGLLQPEAVARRLQNHLLRARDALRQKPELLWRLCDYFDCCVYFDWRLCWC
jgi:hypothetical protein